MHAYTLAQCKSLFAVRAGGEAKRCGGGGRVGAAVCEIEALMSPKDSAKAWGEMAQ